MNLPALKCSLLFKVFLINLPKSRYGQRIMFLESSLNKYRLDIQFNTPSLNSKYRRGKPIPFPFSSFSFLPDFMSTPFKVQIRMQGTYEIHSLIVVIFIRMLTIQDQVCAHVNN